jgi:hypothetical protein
MITNWRLPAACVVFLMCAASAPAAEETLLFSFDGGNGGGIGPNGLTADAKGNLYGTTIDSRQVALTA